MKYLTIALVIFNLTGFCQLSPDSKRGNIWVFGNNHYTPFNNEYTLDFNYSPVTINNINHNIHLDLNNSSICNQDGSLLFFSNGEEVVDRTGNVMPNGDSLTYTDFYQYLNQYNYGPGWAQSVLILPNFAYSNIYYIFHLKIQWLNPPTDCRPVATALMLSIVDMNLNNGYGDVISKNELLIDDTLQCGINAVRHGNGRDWWILIPTYHIGSFYKLLLNPEGVQIIESPEITGFYDTIVTPYTTFSADGSKYIYCFNPYAPMPYVGHHAYIYNFDRCNGSLDLKEDFLFQDSCTGFGVVTSSSSQFLYLIMERYVYQFDLFADNISNTKIRVATYDGYSPTFNPPIFGNLAILAPDEKIYIGAGNSKFVHIIEHPNLADINCNVVQRALIIPSSNLVGSMPNLPNYKLFRLLGSECDNLYPNSSDSFDRINQKFFCYPNPSNKVVNFYLPFFKHSEALYEIEISDLTGKIIDRRLIPPDIESYSYNLENVTSGLYFGILLRNGIDISRIKFIIDK